MRKQSHQLRNAAVVEDLESRRLLSSTLTPGGVVRDKIGAAGETDRLTFAVKKSGSTVEINTTFAATDTGFVPRFTLTGGKNVSWNGAATRTLENLPAGNYTLTVKDIAGKRRGTYGVGLEGISPFSPDAVPLQRGGVVKGSIDDTIDVKEYVFDVLTSGANVQFATDFQATDKGFVPRFTLHRADGGPVRSWNGGLVRTEENLAAGKYMLEVGDIARSRRGSFDVGLEFLSKPFSPDAKPLPNNSTVKGTIAAPLQVDEYTFAATASSASFATTFTATDKGFVPRFTLYDAAGGEVKAWNGKLTREVTGLTANAFYVLKVLDIGAAQRRGAYTVSAKNVKPVTFATIIGSLKASPSPVQRGKTSTLTAVGVTDLANDTTNVKFWRETNGVAGLQTGAGGDLLLATDSKGSDGYSASFSTASLVTNTTYTYYAQGFDANGAAGNVVKTTQTVK